MSIDVMKQALEALEAMNPYPASKEGQRAEAITALRAAIEQAQEPVAWRIWLHGPVGCFDHKQFAEMEFEKRNKEYPDPDRKLIPLYTHPAREPLTDEMRKQMKQRCDSMEMRGAFADGWLSAESAHGIGEKA